MNKRLKLSTGLLLGVALLLSVMNSAPIVTAQVTNSAIHTGDHFTFAEDSVRTESNTRFFQMKNKTTGVLMHGDDELSYDYTHANGQSDVGFIRPDANLPPLGAMDTWVTVRSDLTSQPGSYHVDYQNSTMDQGGVATWQNPTPNTYNTTGQHQGNGEQSMGMYSNATYAVIFPEMEMPYFNLTDQMGGGGGNPFYYFTNFDGLIYRNSTTIETGLRPFDINGGYRNINFQTVSVIFSGFWDQSGYQMIPFGPDGDPNTPYANVSTYFSLSFQYQLNYTYDTANTLLVETSRASSMDILMSFPNQNVSLNSANQGYLWDANVQQDAVGSYSEIQVSTVSTADSFYGNTRPSSTADVLRLKDGDFLTYDWSQDSDSKLEWNYNVQNQTGVFNSRNIMKNSNSMTKGDLIIDLFRHNANMFDAAIALQGASDYSFHSEGSRSDNQGTYYDPSNTFQQNDPNALYLGLIQLPTNSTYDFTPFFESQMHTEYSVLDNCGDNNNGDCLQFNYTRDVNPFGSTNTTSYYINLVQDQKGEYPVINGYTYYEFNATETTQLFKLDYTGTSQISVFYGPYQLWIDVPVTVHADAKQSFYYDSDTGALIAQDQEVHGSISVSYTGPHTLDTGQGYTYPVTVNINVNAYADSHQSMLLKTHPYLYKTQPTMPVASTPPTSTTSTSTSTTTTTSSEQQSSTENTSGAGLPLPVPVLPIAFGLLSMVVIVRKRK